jgi:hypothetical protein
MNEGSDVRTEKRVSVRISDTNCALSTCFAPQTAVLVRCRRRAHLRLGRTAVLVRCGRRAHLRLGRRSVHQGFSVHRLTRGEAKLVREKQSGSAPILGLCLAMPKAFWDEDLSAHSPGHNVAKSLRVRQLVARVHARCVRASTEEAAEKEGAAARTQRRWKRRPTATRRDGWLSE